MKRSSLSVLALALVVGLGSNVAAAETTGSVGNGKIVFQEQTLLSDGTTGIQLFRINKDGTGLTQITTDGVNRGPIWSPSGRFLAFLHQAVGSSPRGDLQVMDAVTGDVHTVFTGDCILPTQFDRPTWSPDETQLLFASSCPTSAFWKIDLDGSNLQLVRNFAGKGFASSPTWSPDGSTIAFSYQPTSQTGVARPIRIFGVNADGRGRLTRLSTNTTAGGAYTPQYSPDGSKLAYWQDGRAGVLAIMVMNADGTNPFPITSSKYASRNPSWSPNGKSVVFTSAEPACTGCPHTATDLFVTHADGSGGTRRITLLPGSIQAWDPTWQVQRTTGA